ncbi:MAG: hypothetical protein AAFP08_11610 [Bacteroidota bacterium]
MNKLLFISFFILILLPSCISDDDGQATLEIDYCDQPLPTEGCRTNLVLDWPDQEAFESYILGDWELAATGISSPLEVSCDIIDPSERTQFSFSADGIFTYARPNGEMGSTAYEVIYQECIVLECAVFLIRYEESLPFRPSFEVFCNDFAYRDDRPVDGSMMAYSRIN